MSRASRTSSPSLVGMFPQRRRGTLLFFFLAHVWREEGFLGFPGDLYKEEGNMLALPLD